MAITLQPERQAGASSPCQDPVPGWLRVWSVLTVLAALPLVTLGAEVTTKKVGMVDPQGFRTPWHLFMVPAEQLHLGYLIEHAHRLFGFVVGICCIVLALAMTLFARGGHRWLGWVALVAVSAQGILGIYRVDLNALFGAELALLHGCLAQLVFAALVGVAVVSSRAWWEGGQALPRSLRGSAVGLCVLVYTQIVFGAVLRHLADPIAMRLHVLLAFAVVLKVFWLVGRLRQEAAGPVFRRVSLLLALLVVLQPVLGVEAWVRRFAAGTLPELVPSSLGLDLARSGHHVLGTLIFATSVWLAVLAYRPVTTAGRDLAPEVAV